MSWSRAVFSSMVSEVGWDDQSGEMIVKWAKGGKVSAYSGVPEDVADTCARAPSVGQFINSQIKPFYEHRYL